jgi:hypothetical protein
MGGKKSNALNAPDGPGPGAYNGNPNARIPGGIMGGRYGNAHTD